MNVQKENLKIYEDVFDHHYFQQMKLLQKATGMWPYSTKMYNAPRRLFYYVLIGFVVPQFNGLRTTYGNDADTFIKILGNCLYIVGIFLKYFATVLSDNKIKNVYNQVAKNWLTITVSEERSILLNYALRARNLSALYTGFIILGTVIFYSIPFYPIVLDLIIPLNHSRKKIMLLEGDFFLDPKEYYYPISAYTAASGSIVIFMFLGNDVAYTIIMQQNIAMFAVIKRRLEEATKAHTKDEKAFHLIVKAIKSHQDTLQSIILIENSYSLCFLALVGMSVLLLSVCAVIMMNLVEVIDGLKYIIVEVGLLLHLYLISFPGQQIIDHSSNISYYVYKNEWYRLSTKNKKLLQFMMLRSLKPSYITAAGLYTMNFENYAMIIKTAISYITVVASYKG